MPEDVQSVNLKRIRHMKENDRNEAIGSLVLLGLKHYSSLYGDQKVEVPVLQMLCDKYIREFENKKTLKERPHSSRVTYVEDVRKSRSDVLAHYPFADDTGNVSDVLRGDEGECEMKTLQDSKNNLHKLLQMGKPARVRLIERTFQEMRLNQVGIRLYDLPEALHRLDVHISPELRLLLEETKSQYNLDGSLRNYDATNHTFYREQFISHTQFSQIVMYFATNFSSNTSANESDRNTWTMGQRSSAANRELQFIQSVLSDKPLAPTTHEQTHNSHCMNRDKTNNATSDGGDSHSDGNSDSDDSAYMYESQSEGEADSLDGGRNSSTRHRRDSHNTNKHPDKERAAQSKRSKEGTKHAATHSDQEQYFSDHLTKSHSRHHHHHHSKHHHKHRRQAISPSSNPRDAFGRQYLSHIKRVPGKLSDLIRADKASFQRAKSNTEKSALAAIARKRVDILSDIMAGPSGKAVSGGSAGGSRRNAAPARRNDAFFSDHNNIGGHYKNENYLALYKTDKHLNSNNNYDRKYSQAQQSQRHRLTKLDSGAAVSEIANSFLHGAVGRELLLSGDGDGEGFDNEDYGSHGNSAHIRSATVASGTVSATVNRAAARGDRNFFNESGGEVGGPARSVRRTPAEVADADYRKQRNAFDTRQKYRNEFYENYSRDNMTFGLGGGGGGGGVDKGNGRHSAEVGRPTHRQHQYGNYSDNEDENSTSFDQVFLRNGQLQPHHFSARQHHNNSNSKAFRSALPYASSAAAMPAAAEYPGLHDLQSYGYEHVSQKDRHNERLRDDEARRLYATKTVTGSAGTVGEINNVFEFCRVAVDKQGRFNHRPLPMPKPTAEKETPHNQRNGQQNAPPSEPVAMGWREVKGQSDKAGGSRKSGGWVADFGPLHTHDNFIGSTVHDKYAADYTYKPWKNQTVTGHSSAAGADYKTKSSAPAVAAATLVADIESGEEEDPTDIYGLGDNYVAKYTDRKHHSGTDNTNSRPFVPSVALSNAAKAANLTRAAVNVDSFGEQRPNNVRKDEFSTQKVEFSKNKGTYFADSDDSEDQDVNINNHVKRPASTRSTASARSAATTSTTSYDAAKSQFQQSSASASASPIPSVSGSGARSTDRNGNKSSHAGDPLFPIMSSRSAGGGGHEQKERGHTKGAAHGDHNDNVDVASSVASDPAALEDSGDYFNFDAKLEKQQKSDDKEEVKSQQQFAPHNHENYEAEPSDTDSVQLSESFLQKLDEDIKHLSKSGSNGGRDPTANLTQYTRNQHQEQQSRQSKQREAPVQNTSDDSIDAATAGAGEGRVKLETRLGIGHYWHQKRRGSSADSTDGRGSLNSSIEGVSTMMGGISQPSRGVSNYLTEDDGGDSDNEGGDANKVYIKPARNQSDSDHILHTMTTATLTKFRSSYSTETATTHQKQTTRQSPTTANSRGVAAVNRSTPTTTGSHNKGSGGRRLKIGGGKDSEANSGASNATDGTPRSHNLLSVLRDTKIHRNV